MPSADHLNFKKPLNPEKPQNSKWLDVSEAKMHIKNTSVFIEDNIKEPFVFQYSFYCIFSEEKAENQTKTKTGKP